MCETNVTLDEFKKSFPEFVNFENIELYLLRAQCYVTSDKYGILSGDSLKLANYLFTEHLLVLQKNIAQGQYSSGIANTATVDKVSVSMVPPPSLGAFEYWLNQTQYGSELLALLSSKTPLPLLLGGSFVRTLF